MSTLWLLLIVLVCPLMMIFMMRAMGGGTKTDHDHAKGHAKGQGSEMAQPVGDAQIRIAQLEREVAELRRVSLRKSDDNPARQR